ncbi:ZIP family metal transporter [Candidatus Woesearchaeota archaeon]|nr:ZIP family metal transporter [Candidatus Woesearchaeota archaeon]
MSFDVSRSLGLVTTLAVIAHEFPEGLISTSLFSYSKLKRSKIVSYSVLVALATPVGAILTFFLARDFFSQSFVGGLLALTAGTFIYVAASDLIPETHEHPRKRNSLIILVGILFIYILSSIFGL